MNTLKRMGLFVALLAFASQASAQAITVTWEASSSSIPTMGTWGLVAMALLLAVVGMRLVKTRGAGAGLMSVVLVVGVLAVSTQTARTGLFVGLPPIEGAGCEGGSQDYPLFAEIALVNNCPNQVKISSYEYPVEVEECELIDDACPVGTVLEANGGSCEPLNYFERCRIQGGDN
jgi:hypothetical protein